MTGTEEVRAEWFTASNGVQVRLEDGEIVTRTPTERGAHLTYHGNRGEAIVEWQASREVTEAEARAFARAFWPDEEFGFDRFPDEVQEDWCERARAALVAAREVRS